MSVQIYLSEGVLTAQLFGEIDHHSTKHIRGEVDAAADRARPLRMILDFRDVTFMDSSGIGLVMGRWALMRELGGELFVENMPGHIQKVMRLAGLEKLAHIESGGLKV
jgi:stage II sporulation protein AA (anti-sigma F factor antagonist)